MATGSRVISRWVGSKGRRRSSLRPVAGFDPSLKLEAQRDRQRSVIVAMIGNDRYQAVGSLLSARQKISNALCIAEDRVQRVRCSEALTDGSTSPCHCIFKIETQPTWATNLLRCKADILSSHGHKNRATINLSLFTYTRSPWFPYLFQLSMRGAKSSTFLTSVPITQSLSILYQPTYPSQSSTNRYLPPILNRAYFHLS